ncbi:MAG: hypothetical protein WAV98_02120 [Minisyncoccia bacterium]
MENETQDKAPKNYTNLEFGKKYISIATFAVASIIFIGVMYAGGFGDIAGIKEKSAPVVETQTQVSEETVLPFGGVELQVEWGNLGSKLVEVGVIDADKFKAIYEQRGVFTDEYKTLLFGQSDGKLRITKDNAGYLLNLFWALGLASKNPILDSGEMSDPKYGGAGNFASTGGWTLAKGNAMEHYSKHVFFELTIQQQTLVDKVSRGIYRPCCGNSTHFPDCNHGMAMLGLLELMASQGVSEHDMWDSALVVNSYWFPDTYITIATYMKGKGVLWKDVNPEEMLGANYSSASGYAKIASQVTLPKQKGGGNCGA